MLGTLAVGIPVARYPPHRSPRADFPHEALIADDWRRGANASPHSRKPVAHAYPALSRVRVRQASVLLAPQPSLPLLRRRTSVHDRITARSVCIAGSAAIFSRRL